MAAWSDRMTGIILHSLYNGSISFIEEGVKTKFHYESMRGFLYFFFQRFTTIPLCTWYELAEKLQLVQKVSFRFTFVFTSATYCKNEQLQEIGKTNRPASFYFLANPNARDTKMYVREWINTSVKWCNIINLQLYHWFTLRWCTLASVFNAGLKIYSFFVYNFLWNEIMFNNNCCENERM
jgi:hypothetical protein